LFVDDLATNIRSSPTTGRYIDSVASIHRVSSKLVLPQIATPVALPDRSNDNTWPYKADLSPDVILKSWNVARSIPRIFERCHRCLFNE